MNLYEELLGEDYNNLSPLIQKMHRYEKAKTLTGQVDIVRGKSFVAKFLNFAMMLPKEQNNAKLNIGFSQENNKEKWSRQFGDDSFSSLQFKEKNFMVEEMGVMKMYFDVFEEEGSVCTRLKESRVFGIKIPKYFTVNILSQAKEENGKIKFSVEVRTFSRDLVIAYDGVIDDVDTTN